MPTSLTRVITGIVLWCFVHVMEATSINGGTPKYSICLVIPKSDTETVGKIRSAIQAAYQKGTYKLTGASGTVPPLSAIKTPLRDGDIDRPNDPAFANSYFLNANSTIKPEVVDANRDPILDRSEIYSGVYGRAGISFYAYNTNGNRGIACGLEALQKARDGEPLGGRPSALSDFGPLDVGSSSAIQDLLS